MAILKQTEIPGRGKLFNLLFSYRFIPMIRKLALVTVLLNIAVELIEISVLHMPVGKSLRSVFRTFSIISPYIIQ